MDDRDRFRFVHGLGLFNNSAPANNTTYFLEKDYNDFVSRYGKDPIVHIHAWCLMKNHYHLLLSDRKENGISMFIRKLNIGYAKYFNKRYDRSGYLFQGRTKRIHIGTDAHFLHILNYVHLNPLDYLANARHWRQRRLEQPNRAHNFLMKYRWSSYADYCGKRNFPSLVTTDFFGEPPEKFRRHIFEYSGTGHAILPDQYILE